MLRRFEITALLILLIAGQVAACTMTGLQPNDLVENTPVYSANGRFCVVVRWQEGIGDLFPPVAVKVRIRGDVRVEVVVSESGDVLCTRNTQLPFGLDRAAVEAARRWKFRPFTVSGHPVKVAGEILFHFQDVNEERWQEVLRNSPPSGN